MLRVFNGRLFAIVLLACVAAACDDDTPPTPIAPVLPRTALVPELHSLARDHACQLNTASPFRGYAIYAVLRKSGTPARRR